MVELVNTLEEHHKRGRTEVLAPLVGYVEIICGSLTKIPMLASGFGMMAHEARTDRSMIPGAIFLLSIGAGPWPLDGIGVARRTVRNNPPAS